MARRPRFKLKFRFLEASGRWDRAREVLRQDLGRLIEQLAPDFIALTEAGDGGRGLALKRRGWIRVQAAPSVGADECAFGFRAAIAQLVDWEVVPVSDQTYIRENGKRSPRFFCLNVAVQLLADLDEVLCFSILHTPSSVEGRGGWKAGPRAIVYRAVVVGWKVKAWAFRRRIRKQLKTERPRVRVHLVLAGDFNLHLVLAWVRKYLGGVFTRLTELWTNARPRRGTLGRRVIDTAWLSRGLRVLAARVLQTVRSSDHRPFIAVIGIRPRRTRRGAPA